MTYSFTSKTNSRPSGSEVPISSESHTVSLVSPFTIKLIEVPLQQSPSSVLIPGYTETSSTSPTGVQFNVNYGTGYVTFSSSAAGSSVLVSYLGRGSIVDAVDIDGVQSLLVTIANEVAVARGTQVDLNTRLSICLNPDGTLVLPIYTTDPSTPRVGTIWYNSTDGVFMGQATAGPVILG